MFITVKRHQREKRELLVGHRLIEAMLRYSDQGLFLLDGQGKVQPETSKALATLFRREEFTGLTFEQLLAPLVSAKTLAAARIHISHLLAANGGPGAAAPPLKDIELQLANPDGSSQTAHYWFDFDRLDAGADATLWLVRVTDISLQIRTVRELEELRSQASMQEEILRAVLERGGARFAAFLQRTDVAMKAIGTVLKQSAREAQAFRNKLEQTLEQVARVRRDAAALKLTALEKAARIFEDALHELRSRDDLSGSDFLPLAVKLDQLYGQFAAVKSLTLAASSAAQSPAAREQDTAASGGRFVDTPHFTAGPPADTRAPARSARGSAAGTWPADAQESVASPGAPANAAPPGSLEHTLQSLTDHVAQEQNKQVVLECRGLISVPPRYQAAIKNVAIQLIRNAVMHGIETPAARTAAGKPLHGTLRLEFTSVGDGFELSFEDDGAGLDPDRVRATAVARGVVSGETAARMRDREAIKLIFKSRYTTIEGSNSATAHGTGMALVRRYIHEAGGKIALASLAGHETRFKITLPPLPPVPSAAATARDLAPEDAKVA